MLAVKRFRATMLGAGRRMAAAAGGAGSEQLVQLERRGAVALVTLNRPSKLNALDLHMFRAIRKVAAEVAADTGVRAVVLCGAGRAFCAGLDVRSLMREPLKVSATMEELLTANPETGATLAQEVSYLWRTMAAPVVVATHGVCLGGGLQIALGADFRFASADATFSIMESKWGLVPDMAGTLALRELLPLDVAKELAMTARVLDAAEAKAIGLVTRVCAGSPLDEALRFAEQLAARSPDCLAATKALFNANYGRGRGTDERSSLEREARLQRKLIGGWNQLASSAKGLGVPSLLQPGFVARNPAWADELHAAAGLDEDDEDDADASASAAHK